LPQAEEELGLSRMKNLIGEASGAILPDRVDDGGADQAIAEARPRAVAGDFYDGGYGRMSLISAGSMSARSGNGRPAHFCSQKS